MKFNENTIFEGIAQYPKMLICLFVSYYLLILQIIKLIFYKYTNKNAFVSNPNIKTKQNKKNH